MPNLWLPSWDSALGQLQPSLSAAPEGYGGGDVENCPTAFHYRSRRDCRFSCREVCNYFARSACRRRLEPFCTASPPSHAWFCRITALRVSALLCWCHRVVVATPVGLFARLGCHLGLQIRLRVRVANGARRASHNAAGAAESARASRTPLKKPTRRTLQELSRLTHFGRPRPDITQTNHAHSVTSQAYRYSFYIDNLD